ncbi:MAG: ADP-heptose--LPS heptosyltransferase [Williamsia sp.]|nr:ADP-heptose--LPS heptosyltransferase [Williamsia sp.]
MSNPIQEDLSTSWLSCMRRGDYDMAWKNSDAVLRLRAGITCWHLPRHVQWIWNGEPLHGKRVLVRCYHGLGDTIQFIRYMHLLKAIAAKVIVWAQAPLIPLLKTIEGIDELLPLHDGTPEAQYDADVEIMELPHIFRTTLGSIPASIPYLRVEPAPLMPNKEAFKVGLVWKAGDWDERRSIPFSMFYPLAGISRVQFYILQSNAQDAGWNGEFGSYLGEHSLPEYARIVRAMDLLISVDSMPVHLAGAMDVPVWTLLHADADWRWMEKREDSPWYPTMRLLRQEHPGEWMPVIEKAAAKLEKTTQS